MNDKRTYTSVSIGSLTSKLNEATKKEYKETASLKRSFKRRTQEHYYRVKAVYPTIKDQALAATMSNYRQYVGLYNEYVKTQSSLIQEYNNKVDLWHDKNQLDQAYVNILENFKKRYRKLKAIDYNAKVEEVNIKFHKMFIKKKKPLRIMPQAEKVFLAGIYSYNKQFEQLEKIKRAASEKSFVSVPKLDFNTGVIRSLKDNGVPLIDFCGRTLRRHRQRLEEAEILQCYEYHGAERGTTLHINNQILAVFCKLHRKYYCLDNQLDSLQQRTKCTDNNILTINKYKLLNKEKIRSSHTLTPLQSSFTGTPISKSMEKNQTTAENLENFNEKSDYLRAFLLEPEILGKKLAAGEYFENEPVINRQDLINEVQSGNLSRSDFRTLLVNYMMMRFNKLYMGKTAYAGSWTKAIYQWLDEKYINKNKTLMNKSTMLHYFFMYDRAYIEVYMYLKKNPEFNLLYPNLYFDNKSKNKASFSKWSGKRIKQQEEKTKEYTQKHVPANKTKSQEAMYLKRLKKHVHDFLNGNKTLDEVYHWSNRNTPKEFSVVIDKHIGSIVEDWNINRNAA